MGGEAWRANLLSRAASERLGGVCAAAMWGVGHDPAEHFERHRRTQREERERRAALAAAGVALHATLAT